jgi:hypothetical protein
VTLLGFELVLPGGPADKGEPLELPVEVRSSDMKLVTQTVTSQWPSVAEGTYIVTARLPAGQSIVTIVEAKGVSVKARLELPSGDWQERSHLFQSARAQQGAARQAAADSLRLPESYVGMLPPDSFRSLGDTFARRRLRYRVTPDDLLGLSRSTSRQEPTQGSLTLFTTRWLDGKTVPLPLPSIAPTKDPHFARLDVPAASGPAFVQVRRSGQPTVNIALPLSQQRGCTLLVNREPGGYWIEAHPANETANLLLGYRQNNLAQQQAATAEQLVYDKLEDPIGASIGAYSLLRFGELDRLHSWTGNLMKFFPWLPDGAAVRGEHLARTAKHAEAVTAFLQVVERGLPLFSEGLRFTFDRLQLYGDSDIAEGTARACRQGAETLKRFLRIVDFDKALTTFAGEPLPDLPELDLATLF